MAPLAAFFTAIVALPAPEMGAQRWMKIGEQSFPIPTGVAPEVFRQQLAQAGVAPITPSALQPRPHNPPPPPRYPVFPSIGFYNTPVFSTLSLNPSGEQKWVKTSEGTEPIAVPFGSDPNAFLSYIRDNVVTRVK